MSCSLDMASSATSKCAYQRLRNEHDEDELEFERERERVTVNKPRSWCRLRAVHIKKRFRLKVPSLRRKRFRLISAFRFSCAKVLKRLKQSQAHFGDLFAGNYLFVQVNPTSMKCVHESCQANQLHLNGLPPTFSLPYLRENSILSRNGLR